MDGDAIRKGKRPMTLRWQIILLGLAGLLAAPFLYFTGDAADLLFLQFPLVPAIAGGMLVLYLIYTGITGASGNDKSKRRFLSVGAFAAGLVVSGGAATALWRLLG